MTLKRTLAAGALILGATLGVTTATMAQPFYDYHYRGFDRGYGYNYGPPVNDTERGGPGPRVESGAGAGIGAQR